MLGRCDFYLTAEARRRWEDVIIYLTAEVQRCWEDVIFILLLRREGAGKL